MPNTLPDRLAENRQEGARRRRTAPDVRNHRWGRVAKLAAAVVCVVGVAVVVGLTSLRPPSRSVDFEGANLVESAAASEAAQAGLGLPAPVDLRIIAVRHSRLAVVDLASREVNVYSAAELALDEEPIDGAAVTADGTVVVWQADIVSIFGRGMDQPSLVYRPTESSTASGGAPSVSVVPSLDGQQLWVVQAGSVTEDQAPPGRADLIEADAGQVGLSAAVPTGSVPVAATPTGLILNTVVYTESADGWVPVDGSEEVIELGSDGASRTLGPGHAIGVSGLQTAVVACAEELRPFACDLWLVDTGSGERQLVSRPVEGEWTEVTRPLAPLTTARWNAASAADDLLIGLVEAAPAATDAGSSYLLFSIDIRDPAHAELLDESQQPFPSIAAAHDGRHVAFIGDAGDLSVGDVRVLDRTTGTSTTLLNAVPDGFHVLAAG